jgi:anaerobic selenocysteine-containing dehydrogenase
VIRAILEEKPYPVRALLLFGSNPLLTYANSQEVFQALKKIEFLVVSELFMTPTAELADLVLPAATNLEFNEIGFYGPRTGQVVARRKVIEPVGECWPDMKIMNELAKKLGFGEHFWADPEECLDLILKPAGLTYTELKDKVMVQVTKLYHKHKDNGLDTPSGKVELYSERLKEMGYSPLPVFTEPPETPHSSPDLAAEFPLLLTSGKSPFLTHSAYRNIPTLRRISGEPITQLHPDTARGLGIKDGDWVYVETKRGRIRQKAAFNKNIDPRVAVVSYGWWFPERSVADLHGWAESNINVLTESAPPHEPSLGSTVLRGMLCKVYKV